MKPSEEVKKEKSVTEEKKKKIWFSGRQVISYFRDNRVVNKFRI